MSTDESPLPSVLDIRSRWEQLSSETTSAPPTPDGQSQQLGGLGVGPVPPVPKKVQTAIGAAAASVESGSAATASASSAVPKKTPKPYVLRSPTIGSSNPLLARPSSERSASFPLGPFGQDE